MTRSMTRWALAGFMALAALGAVAVLDVGSSTAEAAPSVSPFAGSYVGGFPGSYWPWTFAISDGGRITGSYSIEYYGHGEFRKGSLSGLVSADGSFSFTVSESYAVRTDLGMQRRKWSYQLAGNMALDANGNIVGTPGTGGSFVWLRQ